MILNFCRIKNCKEFRKYSFYFCVSKIVTPTDLPGYSFFSIPFLDQILAFLAAFGISMYAVRKIIFISEHRKIYDIPDDVRKFHGRNIPSLGGVGIYTGFLIVVSFAVGSRLQGWNYIVSAIVILFFTGVYDDIMNMRPDRKLIAQLLASFLVVYFGSIRIISLDLIWGVAELPYWLSVIMTTIACAFYINVFNFIDGVDGLASGLAIYYSVALGGIFMVAGATEYALFAFALAGAALGLLYYNRAPARVYMGDTGSMLLGFCIFVLTVKALNTFQGHMFDVDNLFLGNCGGVFNFCTALIAYPVLDALRVFYIRIKSGISPMKADRNHLHYYLIDAGLSHTKTDLFIIGFNICLALFGWLLNSIVPGLFCVLLLLFFIAAFWGMKRFLRRKIIGK